MVGWLLPVPEDAFWAVDHKQGRISRWPLREDTTLIGRSADADIRIHDPRISRQHLRLAWVHDRLFLTHLSGTNPTLVNGAEVSPDVPQELKTSDLLEVGSVKFQVLISPADADAEANSRSWSEREQLANRTEILPKTGLMRGFRLGAYRINPLLRTVTGRKGSASISPRLIDVLLHLAIRSGELVDRDSLLREVWGPHGSQKTLTRSISELRRLLGDDSKNPTYIETVPKSGYRLIAAVIADTG